MCWGPKSRPSHRHGSELSGLRVLSAQGTHCTTPKTAAESSLTALCRRFWGAEHWFFNWRTRQLLAGCEFNDVQCISMHFNAYNLCMVSFWQGLAAPMAWLSERIKLTEPSCEQVHKEQTSNGMKRHEKASKGIKRHSVLGRIKLRAAEISQVGAESESS